MPQRVYCDGITRRNLLRVGTATVGGLTLERLLRAEAVRPAARGRQDVSVIFLFLKGGMSTIDAFDLKPEAPAEIRGEFKPIATNVPGIDLGEHLPRLAETADKFSLIRSFGHRNSDHGPADHYMLTGYHPVAGFNPTVTPNNQRPAFGASLAKTLGSQRGVPAYVCLPSMHNSAGPAYLGPSCSPFVIASDPNSPDFTVPDLAPPLTVAGDRVERRQELLKQVDRLARSAEVEANAAAKAVHVFRQKAFDLMSSAEARRAFDLRSEPSEIRESYGRTTLGQCCLMARRLVEAGVRCVTIEHANWDTHDNNFAVLKRDLLPQFDQGLSGLLRDLAQRGMLDSTLVIASGEFGRTPRINGNAGRDHWGPSFTVLLAGGGIRGGLVLGASDARGERPAGNPVGPEDLATTLFHLAGVDPKLEFHTPEGRPVTAAPDGRVLRELL